MMRTFAMNFRQLLFQPLNNDALREKVLGDFKASIEAWEPRVKIANLDASSDYDNQQLTIRMEFFIQGYSQVFSLTKTI